MQMVYKREEGWPYLYEMKQTLSQNCHKRKTLHNNTGSIHQQNTDIIYIYEPNIRPPKYMRQTLTELKGKVDSYTVIAEDINAPFTIMDIIKIDQ